MFSPTRIVIILIALSCAALEGAQARPFDTRAGLDRRSGSLAYCSQTFEPSLVPRTNTPTSEQQCEALLQRLKCKIVVEFYDKVKPGPPNSRDDIKFNDAVRNYEKGLERGDVKFKNEFERKWGVVKKISAAAGEMRKLEAQQAQPPPRDSL